MKSKRKLISLLMAMALLFGLLPMPYLENVTVYAVETPTGDTSGTLEGTDIKWELTLDDVKWDLEQGEPYKLTLSGSGAMPAYPNASGLPWIGHRAFITTIEVGDGITEISESAFYFHASLRSVTLADSVTSIGKSAFCGNAKLEEIKWSAGLKTIGEQAFSGCSAFVSLELPDGLETIGREAFYGTYGLKAVTLPDSLLTIGEKAFSRAYKLTGITIPKNVSYIGPRAFNEMSELSEIQVAGGNTYYNAWDNVLYEIREDGTPRTAIAYALGSSQLSLNIAEGTESIADYAFFYAKTIQSIVFPDTLRTIGTESFSRCEGLKEIFLPEGLKTIGSFGFCYTGLLTVDIPDSVETIEKNAFDGCSALEKVTIGKGLSDLKGSVFSADEMLSSIVVSEENPYLVSEDNVVFNKDYTRLCYYACAKPDTTHFLKDTVKTISENAIAYVGSLQKLYLPASLTAIAEFGISYNKKLKSIYFMGAKPACPSSNPIASNAPKEQFLIHITAAFTGYENDDAWSYYVENNCFTDWDPGNTMVQTGQLETGVSWQLVMADGSIAFTGSGAIPDFNEENPAPWQESMDVIKMIEAERITGIGNHAFTDALGLLRLETDGNLVRVGENAFLNCGKLRYLDIRTVETIGTAAFQNNASIKNDLILERAASIGAGAFKGCAGFVNAFLGAYLETIEEETFAGCSSLTDFFLPESVSAIGDRAFEGCAGLRTINIPASVSSIGARAFADGSMLEKVYFYGAVPTEWASDCFVGSSNNLKLYYRKSQASWEELGGSWNYIWLVGQDRFYTERQDHYSFSNSASSFGYLPGYRIPRQRYVDVLDSITKGTYYYSIDQTWRGSCYGMAATTLGFYEDPESYRTADYDAAAENLYSIAAPRNPEASLTKLIEASQISQYKSSVSGSSGAVVRNANGYKKLIQRVEEFERSGGLRIDSMAEPVVMLVYSAFAGHAVIPVSVEQTKRGDFEMKVYDPNYPSALQTLIIKKDFSGISYGSYFRASYLNYSAFIKAMSDVVLYSDETDTSVYLSIDKEYGEVTNSEGKGIDEIEGAYEQLPFNGNEEDVFSGIKRFVLPEGNYQIAVSPGEAGPAEMAGEEDETVTFYMEALDTFAEITSSDENAVLNVNGTVTEENGLEIELQSKSEREETTTVAIMNQEGAEHIVEVSGANVAVAIDDNNSLVVEVPNEETVSIDGAEVEVVDGQAVASFVAGVLKDFNTNVVCDSGNKLNGTVNATLISHIFLPKTVKVKAEYFDENNEIVASYEEDMQINFGENRIALSLQELETAFAQTQGDVLLSCRLTVSDELGLAIVSESEDITVTLTKPAETDPTETKPTETETKPTETETKPTETETKPTETETKPTETETKPTETETKPTETETKPTETETKPTETETKPTETETKPTETETKPTETETKPTETETKPTETETKPTETETKPTETDMKPGDNIAVTNVKLNAAALKLGVGETYQLKASVLPENATNQTLTYKASNKKVTVTSKGKIKARSVGTSRVTVKAENGRSAVVKITIKKAPSKITLNAKAKTLKVGKSFQIKAKLPKNTASNKISYSSNKKSVAVVSSTGKITAKKPGTATITVKTFNGKKAKLKITVKKK